jgi:coenzyme F420-reducing hydrogenase alpha subunit
MIAEDKFDCHVKINGKYLREIIQFADFAFKEHFLHAFLNRPEHKFEVWITINADKKEYKKFLATFKQCKIRIFEEKTSL